MLQCSVVALPDAAAIEAESRHNAWSRSPRRDTIDPSSTESFDLTP